MLHSQSQAQCVQLLSGSGTKSSSRAGLKLHRWFDCCSTLYTAKSMDLKQDLLLIAWHAIAKVCFCGQTGCTYRQYSSLSQSQWVAILQPQNAWDELTSQTAEALFTIIDPILTGCLHCPMQALNTLCTLLRFEYQLLSQSRLRSKTAQDYVSPNYANNLSYC